MITTFTEENKDICGDETVLRKGSYTLSQVSNPQVIRKAARKKVAFPVNKHKRKNGAFSKNVVYYTAATLKKFALDGNLEYYVLWLSLKKEFVSGHLKTCIKPLWYTQSQQQYYYDLNQLRLLGLITRQHGKGIRLVSLLKVSGLRVDRFRPSSHIFTGHKELFSYFTEQIIRFNYSNQLKNIILKQLKFSFDDLKISERKRRIFYKTYRSYVSSQRAYKFIKQKAKNRTSLSCARAGELFGKSAWYGAKVFNELIDKGIVRRFVYTIPVYINYTASTLPYLIKKHSDLKFKKGMFYKVVSAFIVKPIPNLNKWKIYYELERLLK